MQGVCTYFWNYKMFDFLLITEHGKRANTLVRTSVDCFGYWTAQSTSNDANSIEPNPMQMASLNKEIGN